MTRPRRPFGWFLALVLLGLVLLGLVPSGASAQARAVLVASGLSGPLFVTAPAGDARLFVVERSGRIRIVENGVTLATPFLDISFKVSTLGEGGLLGLAFPADYASSGLFTVYYTNSSLDSVVARYSVSANPNVANTTEQILLLVDQPDGPAFQNHKGGTVAYGPDGFLWFATGDGGSGNDPNELAQNPQSLLGKMLRIDVGPTFAPGSLPVAGQAYRIPADNPFVGSAPRDEIWASGLRNPYRFSFDRGTGDVWIGDVGQAAREEVNHELASDPGGRNYGWDVMEGTVCNPTDPAPAPPCNDPSLTLPVFEYVRPPTTCASITGGYVYRADFSSLAGRYFFADFCTGQVWSLNPATGAVVDRTSQLGAAAGVPFTLVGFGEDGAGRLLLVQRNTGTIYRIEPAPAEPPGGGCGLGPELVLAVAALAGARRRWRGRFV